MFDSLTTRRRRDGTGRRAAWIGGSMAVQVVVLAVLIIASSRGGHKIAEGPLVPVTFVEAPRDVTPGAGATSPGTPPPQRPAAATAPRSHRPPAKAARAPASEVANAPATLPTRAPLQDPAPDRAEHVGPAASDAPAGIGTELGGGDGPDVAGRDVGGSGDAASGPSGPGGGGAAGPVSFGAGMTPPRLVDAPPLEYTKEALDHAVEGTMVVRCVVAIDGTVRACRVLKSVPFMDRAVVTHLEQRRYRPATFEGKPLDVEYTFTIRLRLP